MELRGTAALPEHLAIQHMLINWHINWQVPSYLEGFIIIINPVITQDRGQK